MPRFRKIPKKLREIAGCNFYTCAKINCYGLVYEIIKIFILLGFLMIVPWKSNKPPPFF